MPGSIEAILRNFPKNTRICNSGCPAYTQTEEQQNYIVLFAKKMREKTGNLRPETIPPKTLGNIMAEVIKEIGRPMGTCKAAPKNVVIDSKCTVDDNQFVSYVDTL